MWTARAGHQELILCFLASRSGLGDLMTPVQAHEGSISHISVPFPLVLALTPQ